MSAERGAFGVLLRGELRYLSRDPAALLLMVVAPVLFYPLLVAGLGSLQEAGEKRMAQQTHTISAPAELHRFVRKSDALEVVEDAPQAAMTLEDDAVTIRFSGDRSRSRMASKRARRVAKRWRSLVQEEHWKDAGLTIKPSDVVDVTTTDTVAKASVADRANARLLPPMLVLLVMSGGLYIALDLFAGEKERGTLETLLSTAAPRREILGAKFAVVLMLTVMVSQLAVGSLWAAGALGIIDPAEAGATGLGLRPLTAVMAGVLLIPLALELAAVMVMAALAAPNFRAGQALAFPLTLLVLAPAGVAVLPDVQLSPLLIITPITGCCLALRDALAGTLGARAALAVTAAAAVHAALLMTAAARLMNRESLLFGVRRPPRQRPLLAAAGVFGLALLLMLHLGTSAQSQHLIGGMVFTQVVLLAGLALGAAWWLGVPLRSTLQIRRPRAVDLGLAMVAGLTAPAVGQLVLHLQTPLIPMPTAFLEGFSAELDVGLPAALLVLSLLPALCEELLFRGTLQGLLRRALPAWAICLVSGAAFGLFHLHLIRVLPTGALGVLLAAAALRGRSLWIAVVVHFLNNATVFVLADRGWEGEASLPALAGAAVVSAGAVALMGRGRA